MNLASMLARQGKLVEAAEQLNELLRLNPDNAEAHNNLGLVFLSSGKLEESVREFSTALRLKPDLRVATGNLQHAQAQINARKK
jgi:Flp pilus assembly protein TadD